MQKVQRVMGMMLAVTLAVGCSGETSESGDGGSTGGTGGLSGTGGSSGGSGGLGGASGSTGGSSGIGGSMGGTGGAAGMGGGTGGGVREYVASVADCINPADPDPDACETMTGPMMMSVDGNDSQTQNPSHAYVRFDLDSALTGASVRTVRLVLRTGPDSDASSDQSGEVWLVESFDRTDLFVTTPASLGSSPIAESMGSTDPYAIPANYDVVWTLPPGIVEPDGSLFFGIIPVSNDGVQYFNTKGPAPKLMVEFD